MNRELDRRRVLQLLAATGTAPGIARVGREDRSARGSGAVSWQTFQGDRARTGHASEGAGPAENPRVRWFVRTNFEYQGPESNPLVFDETVYALARAPAENTALSGDRRVVAVDTADGTERWRARLPSGGIVGGLAASEDSLFLNGVEDIQAVDRASGRRRWSRSDYDSDIDLTPKATPLVVGGDVYVLGTGPEAENGLFVFDAATGDPQWRLRLDALDRSAGTPAYSDGVVYIGAGRGRTVHAVDVETRDERWRFEADTGFVGASPTVRDGTVYAVGDGALYAIDAESGTERWNWETRTSPASVAVTADTVLHCDSQTLAAYDAEAGFERWRAQAGGSHGSTPVVVGDTVYVHVSPQESRLVALDLETGTERWSLPVGGTGEAGISYGDGRLYVNAAGRLFAIEAGVATDPPEPTVSHDPEYPDSGEEVTFTADTDDEDAEHYLWSLGGTVFRSGETVTHTYEHNAPGNRRVNLVVIDEAGAAGMTTDQVDASEDGFEPPTPTPTDEPTATERQQSTTRRDSQTRAPPSETSAPTATRSSTVAGVETDRQQSTTVADGSLLGTEELLALGGGGGVAAMLGLYALFQRPSDGSRSDATASTPAAGGETTGREGEYDQLVAAARDAREHGEYDRALSKCEKARSVAERVEEWSDGHSTQSRVDHAEALEADIEEERDARRLVTDGLDRIDEELDKAVERLDDDRAEAAVDKLDDVSSAVAKAREMTEKHEFSDLSGRIKAQSHRCERLQKRAERTLDTTAVDGVPEPIPSSPSVDLSSADLEMVASTRTADEALVSRSERSVVSRLTVGSGDDRTTLALKQPEPDGTMHADAAERFVERAETWQRIDDHDHVVGVVDHGTQPLPWVAMEYMDAGHLGDRAGELPRNQALWTALSVTRAVRHAHRRGVFHLQLSPGNVLFRSPDGAWDVPKVADWGVSERLVRKPDGTTDGRSGYAAPEQVDEGYGAVDDLTDVYQLGAMCYHLFTGQPPFERPHDTVGDRDVIERLTPPSELGDAPRALDDILRTALATEKVDRYESVLYLRDRLEDLFRTERDT